MEGQREQHPASTYPGNVLVAGCGFIVTGAGWGLFGYLEGDLAATSGAGLFLAMTLLHGLTGVLILARQSIGLPVGLFVAASGLVIAALQPQFVLVFTNVVILLLLVLSRRTLLDQQHTSSTGEASPTEA